MRTPAGADGPSRTPLTDPPAREPYGRPVAAAPAVPPAAGPGGATGDRRAPLPGEVPGEVPGVNVPDRRGRTGLDQAGRDLDGNPRVRVREVDLLSSSWYVLRRTTFDYLRLDGSWTTQERETYDRGNGATVLLYDADRATVLLIRQFRYPAYVNGHPDGFLLETAGGLLDDDDAETAIRREASEETGYDIGEVRHVFDVYMSPGSVTERVHFFAAPYSPDRRTSEGGGLADDGEEIELVELPFAKALAMIESGEIADAKTIMLLQWAALSGPFAGRDR